MVRLRRILSPVDFSPGSLRAVHLALAFRDTFDAQLELMHVWAPPSLVSEEFVLADTAEPTTVGEYALRAAEREMQDLLDQLGPGPHPPHRIEVGHPALVIVDRARDFDLVVMGTHGRRGLDRLLTGSVARQVVQRAPCAVLTVPLTGVGDAPARH